MMSYYCVLTVEQDGGGWGRDRGSAGSGDHNGPRSIRTRCVSEARGLFTFPPNLISQNLFPIRAELFPVCLSFSGGPKGGRIRPPPDVRMFPFKDRRHSSAGPDLISYPLSFRIEITFEKVTAELDFPEMKYSKFSSLVKQPDGSSYIQPKELSVGFLVCQNKLLMSKICDCYY